MQANVYLQFNGQCEEAFRFYEKCFGAKIATMMSHADAPAEMQIPREWREKIMHARMTVGDTIVMASDAPPPHYRKPQGFRVSLGVDRPAEAERIFKELSQEGSVEMKMEETFFAHRFGMTTDRFGIPWMVICEKTG